MSQTKFLVIGKNENIEKSIINNAIPNIEKIVNDCDQIIRTSTRIRKKSIHTQKKVENLLTDFPTKTLNQNCKDPFEHYKISKVDLELFDLNNNNSNNTIKLQKETPIQNYNNNNNYNTIQKVPKNFIKLNQIIKIPPRLLALRKSQQ